MMLSHIVVLSYSGYRLKEKNLKFLVDRDERMNRIIKSIELTDETES